jgi:hypothetical protein
MARNKISDLNNHLFAQLERLNDEELTKEEVSKESTRAKAITSVAAQIIKSHKLTLEAMKVVSQGSFGLNDMPEALELKKD